MPKIIEMKYPKSYEEWRTQTISFLAPAARSVQLVGDFTGWQQRPIDMQKGSDGIWHATIELKLGPHPYRFLVDGQWRDDPECMLEAPNPYGGRNAVCQVAAETSLASKVECRAPSRPPKLK
jgi:1,4-alpha-glucan branching enzyme